MTKKQRLAFLVMFFLILAMSTNATEEESTVEPQNVTITMRQNEVKRKKVLMIKLEENLDNEKIEDEEINEPTEMTEETTDPTDATYPAETESELETEPVQEPVIEEEPKEWNGQVLTAWLGTVQGPSGKETYYNLPMGGVVSIMRDLGYSEEEYPYWIRQDGCKMLGEYIMVAANLQLRPRGTIVETSLGLGLVCDTGGFAQYNQYQIDVAVDW